jgi:hypothetical protein
MPTWEKIKEWRIPIYNENKSGYRLYSVLFSIPLSALHYNSRIDRYELTK